MSNISFEAVEAFLALMPAGCTTGVSQVRESSKPVVQRPPRDRFEVLREYDSEKWLPLLEYVNSIPNIDLDSVYRFFYGDHSVPIRYNDKCFSASILAYHGIVQRLIYASLSQSLSTPSIIVELGAGFGGTLLNVADMLHIPFSIVAADISQSGLAIFEKYSKRIVHNASSYLLDFSSQHELCSFLSGLDPALDVHIFTHFALGCISHYSYNPISLLLGSPNLKSLTLLEPMLADAGEENRPFVDYLRSHCYNLELLRLCRKASSDHDHAYDTTFYSNIVGYSDVSLSMCVYSRVV